MTTVAFKDGIMCADTQVTLGYMKHPIQSSKLLEVKIEDTKLIYGFCGNNLEIMRIRKWIKEGRPKLDKLNVKHEEFTYLCWDGEILRRGTICDDGYDYEEMIRQDFFAIGSGSEYALGAMEVGATAEEAVRVAMKYDIYTGGEILKVEIER